MTDALDWVIVGGGIHGVHVAVRLLGEAGVPRSGIRLVDPGKHLLDSWRRCTANTGMRHLRSPAVHHLDVDPWSLLDFAGANRRGRGAAKGMFAPRTCARRWTSSPSTATTSSTASGLMSCTSGRVRSPSS